MFKIEQPIINNTLISSFSLLSDKNILEEKSFSNDFIDMNDITEINSCQFIKTTFTSARNNRLNNITIVDTIFEDCDLSNISIINSSIHRVIFKNCKLVGLNIIDSGFSNIEIIDSVCNYFNCSGNQMKYIRFSNSSFIESVFNYDKINNIVFDNINLLSSEIYNTPLKNIDLSNSNIEGIKVDLLSLKGSIISSYQALDLINLLGVKIKE